MSTREQREAALRWLWDQASTTRLQVNNHAQVIKDMLEEKPTTTGALNVADLPRRRTTSNPYLDTIDRLEPEIAAIDTAAGWASTAISQKRMADAMERTAGAMERMAQTLETSLHLAQRYVKG